MVKKEKILNILFWLTVIGYAIYAAAFIAITRIDINGTPYFTLFDDAMISMQYARNLAGGNGLVWNAGDIPVEGISNPLWTIYMAVFHLFPIPINWMGLPIKITGAILLLINLFFIKKITEHLTSPGSVVPLAAVILVAFYYPLNVWSLHGLEVGLLILITSAAILMVIRGLEDGKFSFWLYILLGASTLVRIDMLALGLATWGFLVIFDPVNRRKHLIWGFLILAGFMMGQTLLRWLYYGDFLPNTYYLKMTGISPLLRIKRGIYVFVKFVWNFNIILFLLPFLLLIFRRDKAVLYLFLIFAVQVAYSIYVGGDAWEHRGGSNRFFSVVMPAFMILFVLTLDELRIAILDRFHLGNPKFGFKWLEPLSEIALVLFTILSLLNFNALLDTLSLQYSFLQKPTIYTIGEEKVLRMALFVRDITDEDARILVFAAGGLPYYSQRYSYDMLGKSDRVIAHEEMRYDPSKPIIDLRPGHSKWDYAHSIKNLEPDVIPEIWPGTLEEAQPYLQDYTIIQMEEFKRWLPNGIMYVRTASPHVNWDKIKPFIIQKSDLPSS